MIPIVSAGRRFLIVNGYRIVIDQSPEQSDDFLPRELLFPPGNGCGRDRSRSDDRNCRAV
jgi:hypothetical protein